MFHTLYMPNMINHAITMFKHMIKLYMVLVTGDIKIIGEDSNEEDDDGDDPEGGLINIEVDSIGRALREEMALEYFS